MASEKQLAMLLGICSYNNKDFLLVDIPGTYSLLSNSQEEEIARNYICFGNADATVIILDATCIEKNLNLVFQTLEITDKVVVCVNLLDEAKKKGIEIDLEKLSDTLGVPVVGTIARKKNTLKKLREKIYEVSSKKTTCTPKLVKYSPIIEDAILLLNSEVYKILPDDKKYLCRWFSLKLLDQDEAIINSIETNLDIKLFNDTISKK